MITTGTATRAAYNSTRYSDDENVLSMYLKEINRIPLLTREQEIHHARLAAQGDPASKEALINGNLRFVVNVAK